MKKKHIAILILAVSFTAGLSANAGNWNLNRPGGVGFALVGTRQDASQMHSSGLGLGMEVFLRYPLSSQFNLSVGTGFSTATDDIFKMENQKLVFLPTLELRAEFVLFRGEWFRPFVYSGVQFLGAATHVRDDHGITTSSHSYQGCAFVGLGSEIQFGRTWSMYFSADCRYGAFSTIKPNPQYWIAKTGLCFKLGHQDMMSRNSEENEFTKEILALLASDYAEESNDSNQGARLETAVSNERLDRLENYVLQNSNSIHEMANQIQDYVRAAASVAQPGSEGMALGTSAPSVSPFKGHYNNGLEKFKQSRYDEAILVFERLRTQFPDHALVSNCTYWIGECYHAQGLYTNAIVEFEKVFQYSASYKYDDALLMKGKCYTRMGDRDLAATSLQSLLDRFPDSEYVSRAKILLQNM